jgi:3-hydroxybutyryl-CoA dehydrogenase
VTGTLAILGPGTLGVSAAQWAAECGLECRLLGRDLAHAQAGVDRIHRQWDSAEAKGRLGQDVRREVEGRLVAAALGPGSLEGVTTLLEALPEDQVLKVNVWSKVARWADPTLLMLSGTSSLPISVLAGKAGLEGRLLGFHLFVPVPRMAVVEMAVPAGADPGRVKKARELGESLKKRVVQVVDQPGFAAARMALAQGLEAMRLLEAGVATAEDLDALMTLGYGHPVGPLELSDRIGLDLRLRIARGLEASGEARFSPPQALVDLAQAGHLGRKASRGFFSWDAFGRRP